MKQKSFMKMALATILCVIAGYICLTANQYDQLNGLVLDNIEALATTEGDVSYDCLGSGSVSCHGDWVKVKIEGYSLDLE